ncbi:MAG TPA: hypothetical protein VLJ37_09690 [bacterium]|nr:hypothetical protein [bacterium]
MTCNPAIATCLPPIASASTGFFGPNDLGPVCNAATPADSFGMCEAPLASAGDAPGMASLFAPAPLECSADRGLPPSNVDLRLADYRTSLPGELTPYIEPMLRLETEFNVSVSFRIVQARLSNGETVPQIVFFRTGDTPSIAATGTGGSGPGGPGAATARTPTSTGMFVSLTGAGAAIVAYDRFLLQALVDRHILPEEARIPVLFTSVMASHLALYRAGLVSVGPVEGLRGLPTFLGYQILARLLLERIGAPTNSFSTDLAGVTLATMPFILQRLCAESATQLSTAAGRALAEGAVLRAAALGTGAELMVGGASVLRVSAVFARMLGWIGIIDIGARAGVWGIGRIYSAASSGDYRTNVRLWNLIRLSQDIYNQERFGSVLSGAFGMIWTFFDSVDSMVSSESDAFHTRNVERIRDTLVSGSDAFGDSLHQSLIAILAQNTRFSPDGAATTDWDAVERDVRAFYRDERNAENIRNGYNIVDDATAPMTSSGIESLIGIVSDRGEIRNRTEFREHMARHVRIRRIDVARRLNERSLELGLSEVVNGVAVSMIPTDPAQLEAFRTHLTPAQREFLDGEGLRLSMELMTLSTLPH